jgi:hypothetical protein
MKNKKKNVSGDLWRPRGSRPGCPVLNPALISHHITEKRMPTINGKNNKYFNDCIGHGNDVVGIDA